MRILQIAKTSLPPGGQSNTVHQLSDALAARGHQVTLLALRGHPRDRESILASVKPLYRPELLKLPRTRGCFHNAIFTRAIRRLAAGGGLDLVHAHMLYPEGFCAMQAVSGLKLPLIVTGHGEDIQVDPACVYGVRLDRRIDRKVRLVIERASRLVAIGDAMKTQMVDAGALPEKVTVIRWGYRLEPPAEAPGEAPGYLLSVGRFVPKKGYDLLLRAMRLVLDRRPGERLLIAGDGPGKDALEAQAADLGLKRNVTFLGFVDGGAKTSLYGGARLFVCPSRWEPLGLVNLEAMASGLPVVAFDVDGIPEIVEHGTSGLLAPAGDPAALARSMLRLLEDRRLHARMSEGARRSAAAHDWCSVAARHERLYENALAGGCREGPVV